MTWQTRLQCSGRPLAGVSQEVASKSDPDGSPSADALRAPHVPPTAADVVSLRPPGRVSPTGASSGFADALAVELAHAIVRLAADNPSLVAKLRDAIGAGERPSDRSRLLMRKAEYADRVGYSVRTLDKLIAAGLPTHGHGKLLRIVVNDADEWLLARDAGSLEDVDLLAMRNATKRSGGGAHGG